MVLVAGGLIAALVTGEPSGDAVSLHSLFSEATVADRLIAIGLLVLAFTPVMRVVALIAIWIGERDWRFVVLSLIVAAILAVSILSGW